MKKCVVALIYAGTGVIRPGNCSNAFKCTAVNSNQETLDATIRAGTEVSIISCVGLSPLSLAVIGGSNICIKQLLNAGAEANLVNCQHLTPLMLAAIHNYPDCIKTLLQKAANVNILDADGKTAVAHATENGHTECLDLLIKAGASVNTCDNVHTSYVGSDCWKRRLCEFID